MNPMEFESEQMAVIDHYERHGDQYERRITTYHGRFAWPLTGTVAMDFTVTADQRYEFIAHTVRRFGYARLKRADKTVMLRFLERISCYSRQQITRLVKRGRERCQLVKRYQGSRTNFARTHMGADVLLLAHADALHDMLSSLATKSLWNVLTESSAMPATLA